MKELIYTIAVEFGAAGEIDGAELGAPILKESIIDNRYVIDGGSVTANDSLPIYAQTAEITRSVSHKVFNALNANNKCLIIGGDHSIALGSIIGATKWASNNSLNIGVIYFDAHTDCNVPESSKTGNLHGMPIAFAMGRGNCELAMIAEHPLPLHNIIYIGARSIDKPEVEFIEKHNIPIVTSSYINDNHADLNTILEVIQHDFIDKQQIDVIHLSIDIDVVDPKLAPGTGVPEINGISTECFQNIIANVIKTFNVISVDFVEYNPLLDIDDKTLKISNEALNNIVKLL